MCGLGRLYLAYFHQNHRGWALYLERFAAFLNAVVHESIHLTPYELQHEKSMADPLRRLIPFPDFGTVKVLRNKVKSFSGIVAPTPRVAIFNSRGLFQSLA
jgi:hypothetical protein